MPPINFAPGAHYAETGTPECDMLYEKARAGKYAVIAALSKGFEEGKEYKIFAPLSMDLSLAVSAFTLEHSNGRAVMGVTEFVPGVPAAGETKKSNPKRGLLKILGIRS